MKSSPSKRNKNAKLTEQVVSALQDGISTIFRSMGFHVAKISFSNMITDQQICRLINESYQNTEVAKELVYFPDFFVMHGKKDPKEGVLFIHCHAAQADSTKRSWSVIIDPERVRTFMRFFPCDKIIMVVSQPDSSATVLAQWFPKCVRKQTLRVHNAFNIDLKKMETLRAFIKAQLKMDVDDELLREFNEDLMKIYRPTE